MFLYGQWNLNAGSGIVRLPVRNRRNRYCCLSIVIFYRQHDDARAALTAFLAPDVMLVTP